MCNFVLIFNDERHECDSHNPYSSLSTDIAVDNKSITLFGCFTYFSLFIEKEITVWCYVVSFS